MRTSGTFSSATRSRLVASRSASFCSASETASLPCWEILRLVQVGPGLHQVFRPFLDLRLPVPELVALEPVAHAAQLHVDPAQRVARLLGEVAHHQLEVLERLDGQDIG